MSALKALCNPVWISVSSEDPFQTVFKLQSMEEEFERVSGSFAMEFEDLLNQVRSNEVICGSSPDRPENNYPIHDDTLVSRIGKKIVGPKKVGLNKKLVKISARSQKFGQFRPPFFNR